MENFPMYYQYHTAPVTCISQYRDIVISGQEMPQGSIHIWRLASLFPIQIIQFPTSVIMASFSLAGEVFSVITSEKVYIYDIFGNQKANDNKIMDTDWDISWVKDEYFILSGKKGLVKYEFDKTIDKLNAIKILDKNEITCVIANQHAIVIGLYDGSLELYYEKYDVFQYKNAHEGHVTCLTLSLEHNFFISGGTDGIIIVWKIDIENTIIKLDHLIKVFEGPVYQLNCQIQSVCEFNNNQYTVTTRRCEIVEYRASKPKLLMCGHFGQNCTGICYDKYQNEFYTCGDDGLIAQWRLDNKSIIKRIILNYQFTCCAISENCHFIGFGTKSGHLLIFNGDLELIQTLQNPQKISCVTFSPDSTSLFIALDSPSNFINVYNLSTFTLSHNLGGSQSKILSLDVSQDSQVLQVSNSQMQNIYYDIKSASIIKQGEYLHASTLFYTKTSKFNWSLFGIYQNYEDIEHIHKVLINDDIAAIADIFGRLRLFRHPANLLEIGSTQIQCFQNINQINFLQDGKYLVVLSSNAVLLYSLTKNNPEIQFQQPDLQDQGQYEYIYDQEMESRQISNKKGHKLYEQVKEYIPTEFQDRLFHNQLPNVKLEMNFVFGFYPAKNSVILNNDRQIVYIQSSLGVVHNESDNQQCKINYLEFFNGHDSKVTCLAVNNDRKIIATGQSDSKNINNTKICIWDSTDKCKLRIQLDNVHKNAVQILKFSPNGDLLLSIGKDKNQTIAVHFWRNKKLMFKTSIDQSPVNDVSFSSNVAFTTVGDNHIRFWNIFGTNYSYSNGQSNIKQMAPIYCVTFLGENCFTGNSEGFIELWQKQINIKKFNSHRKAINVMLSHKDHLYSGGQDGYVYQWSIIGVTINKLITVCDVSKSPNHAIISLYINPSVGIVVATEGGQIYYKSDHEVQFSNIVNSIIADEIIDCAMSPEYNLMVTIQSDKKIIKWDLEENNMFFSSQPFDGELTVIDWSSDGSLISCADDYGMVFLVDSQSLDTLDKTSTNFVATEHVTPKITVLKFSSDHNMIALAGQNYFNIQILSIVKRKLQPFTLILTFQLQPFISIDWSDDSSIIQANTLDNTIFFYNPQTQQPFTNKQVIQGLNWRTHNCAIQWSLQGVYSDEQFQGVSFVDKGDDWAVIANKEQLELIKWPSTFQQQLRFTYPCHPGGIRRVKVNYDYKKVFSCGAKDRTIICWYVKNLPENDIDDSIYNKQGFLDTVQMIKSMEKFGVPNDNNIIAKPYKMVIQPPSNHFVHQELNGPPAIDMQINHVFGYKSYDQRNNIKITSTNHLVYPCSALIIVMNPFENTQKYFTHHKNQISALEISKDGHRIASGDYGHKPMLYIWGVRSMVIESEFNNFNIGIVKIAFSDRGRWLVAAGADHQFMIIDLINSHIEPRSFQWQGGMILELIFNSENDFYSMGKDHFYHWTVDALQGEKIHLQENTYISSCDKYDGQLYTAQSNGMINFYQKVSHKGGELVHRSQIDSIIVTSKYIFSGDKSGIIIVTNLMSFEFVVNFDLTTVLQNIANNFWIRSMSLFMNNKLIVGTFGSEIFELEFQDMNFTVNSQLKYNKTFMSGHYKPKIIGDNSFWGLCVFPMRKQYFASTGDDGTLRIYDSIKKKIVNCYRYYNKSININLDVIPDKYLAKSIGISQDEHIFIVGFIDGSCRCFNISDDLKTISEFYCFNDSKSWISDIKFSPDKKQVAIASHDGNIYLYNIIIEKSNTLILFYVKLQGHTSQVMHIDYSVNSLYLQSGSNSYELYYWDILQGKRLTDNFDFLKDEKWYQWSQVFGWPVQGIQKHDMRGIQNNSVSRSNQQHSLGYFLLAKGDDNNQVSIYKYPTVEIDADCVQGTGHSSYLSKVMWSMDDSFLYSLGGKDLCLIQWKVNNQ